MFCFDNAQNPTVAVPTLAVAPRWEKVFWGIRLIQKKRRRFGGEKRKGESVCVYVRAWLWGFCVYKQAIRICLCVCVCAFGSGGVYTPYCPIYRPLSTHHNCQYLVRYDTESEEEEKPVKWILLLYLPVEHGKVDLALPPGPLLYSGSPHGMSLIRIMTTHFFVNFTLQCSKDCFFFFFKI